MLQRPLFSRRSAVVSGIILALIFLGCMSFGDSTRYEVAAPEAPEVPNPNLIADGMLEQVGNASIPGSSEQDVYYPVPFIGPPNLLLEGATDYVKLVSQRRDHFRVKNIAENTHYLGAIHWRANGIRATLLAPASAGPVPAVVSPKMLPPEPVPATAQP